MFDRSEEDVLQEVKELAVAYYELTQKPLGVAGEIAEFEAAEKLGLRLMEHRMEGYDAVDQQGKKVLIKGRWKRDGSGWGQVSSIDTNKEFDTVLLVLLHNNYETLEVWEAVRAQIIATLDAPGSKARNERRVMGVNQFKKIAHRVWPLDSSAGTSMGSVVGSE